MYIPNIKGSNKMAGLRAILDGIIQANGILTANLEQEEYFYQVLQGFLNFRCHGFLGTSG